MLDPSTPLLFETQRVFRLLAKDAAAPQWVSASRLMIFQAKLLISQTRSHKNTPRQSTAAFPHNPSAANSTPLVLLPGTTSPQEAPTGS